MVSWSLRTKLIAVSIAAVIVTAVTCLVIQRSVIRRQGIDLTRNSMRGVLMGAENVRQSVSAMRNDGVFKTEMFSSTDARKDDARILQTVPVVAAWRSIEKVAAQEGYEFHIAARSPRDAKNQPRESEAEILQVLENGGAEDYFGVDEQRREIVYARPIRLTRDCLLCHGDPATSPTHDGRDILGLPMENWAEGQIHGVFVLRSSLDRLNPVIQSGVRDALIWIVPLAGLVGVVVAFVVNRIGRRLSRIAVVLGKGARTVDEAVAHIAASSNSLAQGATEHASALEETSASSEEINSMARRNTEHAEQAMALARKSQEEFGAANRALVEMESAMADINAQSGKISRIIKVIDEIAFQTNILALNAAVEAARAGEAGMGFAVVAGEVRNLAQRSAQAARDTTLLIEESIGKSAGGKRKVDQVAVAVRAITEESAGIQALVEQVHEGSREQTRGIELITHAVAQMSQVTQDTAAHAEEGAAAATELGAQSQTLKQAVEELTAVVDGGGTD